MAGPIDVNYCAPRGPEKDNTLPRQPLCKVNSEEEGAIVLGMPSFPPSEDKKLSEFAKKYGLNANQLRGITSTPLQFRALVKESSPSDKSVAEGVFREATKYYDRIKSQYPRFAEDFYKSMLAYAKADKDKDGVIDQKEYAKASAEDKGRLIRLFWIMKLQGENSQKVTPMERGAFYYCSDVMQKLPICKVENAEEFYIQLGGSSFPDSSKTEAAHAEAFRYGPLQRKQIQGLIDLASQETPIDFKSITKVKSKQEVVNQIKLIILKVGSVNTPLADDLKKCLETYVKVDKDGDGNINKKEYQNASGNEKQRLLHLAGILAKAPRVLDTQVKVQVLTRQKDNLERAKDAAWDSLDPMSKLGITMLVRPFENGTEKLDIEGSDKTQDWNSLDPVTKFEITMLDRPFEVEP